VKFEVEREAFIALGALWKQAGQLKGCLPRENGGLVEKKDAQPPKNSPWDGQNRAKPAPKEGFWGELDRPAIARKTGSEGPLQGWVDVGFGARRGVRAHV
jgi:hypothetical protein